MKREIERTADLPTIQIDCAELSVLIDRLLEQFADPSKARVSISLQFDKEKVSAKSVSELQQATGLPARVFEFDLSIFEDHQGPDRHVIIWSKPLSRGTPRVVATGESEAWAAGAIETAKVFFARHRAPFYWIARVPIGFIVFMATLVYIGASLQSWKATHAIPWSWTAGYLSGVAIKLLHERLARSELVLRDTESAISRVLPQLGFVVAVASLVVAVLAWLFPRAP